jgi:hypothetical protein
MTEGGALVATGWKMFSEVILTLTVLVTEVIGPVGEMIVLGVEIGVLIKGPLLSATDDSMLVTTVPLVPGVLVLRVGSIWTVPKLVKVVETGTLDVTVEVVTDWKKMPPEVVDIKDSSEHDGAESEVGVESEDGALSEDGAEPREAELRGWNRTTSFCCVRRRGYVAASCNNRGYKSCAGLRRTTARCYGHCKVDNASLRSRVRDPGNTIRGFLNRPIDFCFWRGAARSS